MLHSLKWEFNKLIHAHGYYALAMIGFVIVSFFIPEGVLVVVPSVAIGLGCVFMILLPFENTMSIFKQPGFNLERQRRKSGYKQLFAKLGINIVIITFMQIVAQSTEFAMKRFENSTYQGFSFVLKYPLVQVMFEMAVLYPVVFLSIYYWLGRRTKISHGIVSGFASLVLCEIIRTLDVDLWSVMLIEVIVAGVLIYLLGKWIEKTKEPYC